MQTNIGRKLTSVFLDKIKVRLVRRTQGLNALAFKLKLSVTCFILIALAADAAQSPFLAEVIEMNFSFVKCETKISFLVALCTVREKEKRVYIAGNIG